MMDNLDLMQERLEIKDVQQEHTVIDNLNLMYKRIHGSNT